MQNKKDGDNYFVVTCVIYLIILAAIIFLRIAGALGWFDAMSNQLSDTVFSLISQLGVMLLIPLVGMTIYRRKMTSVPMTFAEFAKYDSESLENRNKGTFSFLGFKKPSVSTVGWAILLGFILFLFNMFISGFFNGILAFLGHRGAAAGGDESSFVGVGGLFITLTLTAVLPGLCEETAHRGMLLRGFSSRIGIMNAVLLSSLCFGLMHLNIVQCFYAMILGYFMGLAVVATGTIWTSIIMHFMNNAIGIYFMFASQNNWFGGNFLSGLAGFLGGMSFIFYLAFFMCLFFLIVAIIHKLAREKFINEHKNDEQPPRLFPTHGLTAIRYYLSYGENRNREPMRPIERTLIYGIIFLGVVITGMTLVWGFL